MRLSNFILRAGATTLLVGALGACSFYDSVKPRWHETAHCNGSESDAPQGSSTYAKAFRQAPGDIRLSREQHLIPYNQQVREAGMGEDCHHGAHDGYDHHHPHRR